MLGGNALGWAYLAQGYAGTVAGGGGGGGGGATGAIVTRLSTDDAARSDQGITLSI